MFSRPKALNLSDHDLGTEKLATIAELQEELSRSAYNKPAIVALANQVRGYFTINKTRGRTPLRWSRSDGTYKVTANGRGDWDGFIELTRARFNFESVKNTGKFMRGLDADVLAVCEAENVGTLRMFRTAQLSREGLINELLIDGNDPRGIDIGMYSKFPLGTLRTNMHDKATSGSRRRIFSRDCLEAEVLLPSGNSLHILQNHLKSKLGPSTTSDARRKSQAERISEILDQRYDLDRQFVIVAGDLNDTPDSDPLSPILDRADVHDCLEAASVPAGKRWTYSYRGQKNQIDYVLISTALKAKLTAAGVDRRGIANLSDLTGGEETSMTGITNWRNAASDHGAVWAEFDL